MRFTNKPYNSFLDRFHDVRKMLKKSNDRYLENYTPSWLSLLDELMTSFLYKFCPGFMSVTHNPTLLEMSTIALQMEMRVIP